jgi:hypothetical protein
VEGGFYGTIYKGVWLRQLKLTIMRDDAKIRTVQFHFHIQEIVDD